MATLREGMELKVQVQGSPVVEDSDLNKDVWTGGAKKALKRGCDALIDKQKKKVFTSKKGV